MSSVSSTTTLASWDPTELFQLVNPDKMSITCVGYAPSCRRRCRNPIAYHNVQAAKAVMRQVVRSGVGNFELKEMLLNLAEYTLCRRYHQDQATDVSTGWFAMVQRHRVDEDDRGSDTSDDDDDDSDDGSSSSDDSDDGNNDDSNSDNIAYNDDAQELRRRFDELEILQREFEGLLQRQRQSLQSHTGVPSSLSTLGQQSQALRRNDRGLHALKNTASKREVEREAEQDRQEQAYLTAQREREAAREQLHRDRAERARREESQRRAQREKEEEAEAEAERLAKEQAEQARLHRERQAKANQEQKARDYSWASAWNRYEADWTDITQNGAHIDTDIRASQIWPTRSGSFDSCCEEDVRAFFRCRPEDAASRRMLRRQALRWHPDRAARLFARVVDELVVRELLKTVTMISQVVIGIMGVASG